MRQITQLRWALAMLLLPLALAGWTSLQGWRADNALQTAETIRQWLAVPSDTLLQRIPKRERNERLREADRREAFQRQVDLADADRAQLGARQALAASSHWLAIAALLTGAAAWLMLRVDAWRARASRDFLHQQLSRSWHRLGQCLTAYTALLVGALGLSALYEMSWGWSHYHEGGLIILVVVLPMLSMVWIGVMLILRLRTRWRLTETPSCAFLGRPLTRQQAPGLWAWVEHLAAQLNAPAPEHIVVGIDQSFFVTSTQVVLQPSGEVLNGRTLYLPLTYLSALSQHETASIIGHELGHFSSRDTERGSETSARFSLMYTHFSSIATAEEAPSWIERPTLWMTGHFLHHFQIAVHHWSRAQELVADRAGAQVAGARTFCQALLRVIALDNEIDTLLHGPRRDHLVQALAQHLQHHRLHLSEQALEIAITHPFDTHPATAVRLQQLGGTLDDQLLAEATRAPTESDSRWFNQLLGNLPAPEAL